MFEPSYLKLHRSGELDERIERLYRILESCELCPRKCAVNRLEGKKGYCRSGKELFISSYYLSTFNVWDSEDMESEI